MDLLSHFVILLSIFVVVMASAVMIIIFACCPRGSLRRHAYTQTDDQKPDFHVVVIHPDQDMDLSATWRLEPASIEESL